MATVISGKAVADSLKSEVSECVKKLNEKGVSVCLAVILVGNDPASEVYVNNKKKACGECGIKSLKYTLPESTTQEELLTLIDSLNKNAEVNGILCQLPLPKHIDENAIIRAIDPHKDVDCFHSENVGKLYIGGGILKPCTPAGVMEILRYAGVEVSGKRCVVVGRSNIVGKPMSALLMAADGTVTVCHSRTKDLASITKEADILVVAMKNPKYITGDMVKDGAVVIDVGINRLPDGKLCGDVDFVSVEPKASYITPVPGGVGPMTIAYLMKNTVVAAEMQNNLI